MTIARRKNALMSLQKTISRRKLRRRVGHRDAEGGLVATRVEVFRRQRMAQAVERSGR